MKIARCLRAYVWAWAMLVLLTSAAVAQMGEPASLPANLSASDRADFESRRESLISQRTALQGEIQQFNANCARVDASSPQAATCSSTMAAILAKVRQFNAAVDDFNRQLESRTAEQPAPSPPPSRAECADIERQVEADRREMERMLKEHRTNQEELERWSQLNSKAQKDAVLAGVKFVFSRYAADADDVRESVGSLQQKTEVLARQSQQAQTAARRMKVAARLAAANAELKPLQATALLKGAAEHGEEAIEFWHAARDTMYDEFRVAAHHNQQIREALEDPELRDAFVGDDVETPARDVMLQLAESALKESTKLAKTLERYTPLVGRTVDAATFCIDASYDAVLSYVSNELVGQQNELAGELARSSAALQQKYKRSIDRLQACRTQ
ncbi:MAG TPA: hypothetical protein VF786_05840 [Terriglobales bacterium]